MKHPPCWRMGWLLACLCITTFCAGSSSLSASNRDPIRTDSVHRGMLILYIENINYDCFPDTVWGTREGNLNNPVYLPKVIVWGKIVRDGKVRQDTTAKCKGHIPEKLRVDYTHITYPAWKDLGGSIDIRRFNPEDTLADMIFALRGRVGEGGEERDSTKLLVIFGQHGLDTIVTIDLAAIAAFQSDPFIAVELRTGVELVNGKKRDISGRKSYELLPVGFTMREPDTTRNVPAPTAGVVRIYPNPTGIATQVEAESIPAGAYGIEVVSVDGEVVVRQDVMVEDAGSLLRTFDVQQLPSGYYVIRLVRNHTLVGTYPFIVTR